MKKIKRILFLVPTPPPFAGPEVANEMLLNSKAFQNADVVHVRANLRKKNEEKGGFDLKGLLAFVILFSKVFYFLLSRRPTHFYFLLSSSKVGYLRDVVYILLAKVVFRKQVIAHYRGSNFDGFYKNQRPIYRKFVSKSLRLIDRIIVQGEVIKSCFSGIYETEKLSVVYNGIESINTPAKKIKKNTVRLLFMGHLWFPKGFFDLIRAYKILYSKYGEKISLQLAGEFVGYNMNALEFLNGDWRRYYLEEGKMIEETMDSFIREKEQNNVLFDGVLNGKEKEKAFQEADIFVLPSYTEGFSMACLEAMNNGLPIVTTPVGALQEVIKPGINGFLTPAGDPKALAENLGKLIEDDGLRQSISANNRREVKDCYDIEVIAKQLIETITG